jgi:hypothetical protein
MAWKLFVIPFISAATPLQSAKRNTSPLPLTNIGAFASSQHGVGPSRSDGRRLPFFGTQA